MVSPKAIAKEISKYIAVKSLKKLKCNIRKYSSNENVSSKGEIDEQKRLEAYRKHMARVSPAVLVTDVNGLNNSITRQKLSNWV